MGQKRVLKETFMGDKICKNYPINVAARNCAETKTGQLYFKKQIPVTPHYYKLMNNETPLPLPYF
jgi:hypothetical protein